MTGLKGIGGQAVLPFLEIPGTKVSPPEEILAVLNFAFSASASYWPRPFIVAGLTEDERSPVRDGRMSSEIAMQCRRQIERDHSAQNARAKISTSPNVHAKVHVFKFISRFLFSRFGTFLFVHLLIVHFLFNCKHSLLSIILWAYCISQQLQLWIS